MSPLYTKLNTTTFLTDGGLETDLIFNKEIELPHFAAFPLLDRPDTYKTLKDYYKGYLEIARKNEMGFILDSPTWRANLDWVFKLGYTQTDLIRINKSAIDLLKDLRNEYNESIEDIYISGMIGPRGDGYAIDRAMTTNEARNYHNIQISTFKKENADLVSAITMTYSEEAIGIALAAKSNDIPVVLSFTVETDGRLPSGETIEEAINKVDTKTDNYPLYYMLNCAHPTHFMHVVESDSNWKLRIRGIRANASCKSHAELDESTELDIGDKHELGQLHNTLLGYLPNLTVFGGCCGTDMSHIESICHHILEVTEPLES